jgi:hypothetical protein
MYRLPAGVQYGVSVPGVVGGGQWQQYFAVFNWNATVSVLISTFFGDPDLAVSVSRG